MYDIRYYDISVIVYDIDYTLVGYYTDVCVKPPHIVK